MTIGQFSLYTQQILYTFYTWLSLFISILDI